uniref:Uncharacterized protein n=1 Tax=Anguilla anguilla TaxID=7936 RepID=A0A0E9Q3L3_ANGAN
MAVYRNRGTVSFHSVHSRLCYCSAGHSRL